MPPWNPKKADGHLKNAPGEPGIKKNSQGIFKVPVVF